jgi:3-methyladenine DNA glycosylase/8-oxoguanine DNA glycosylase
MTSAAVCDPLAYQPSPLAGVHSMDVPAIAEEWRPYRSLATVYRSSAAFEPVEALPVARHMKG